MDEEKMAITINWDELEIEETPPIHHKRTSKKEKLENENLSDVDKEEEKRTKPRKKDALSESIREIEIEDLNLKHSTNESKIMIEIKYRKLEKATKGNINKQILSFLDLLE